MSSNILDISKIINSKSLSFETIQDDILNKYIANLPDGQVWKDSFYKTSDGAIILALLSGLGAFKAFHELSRIRESSLDNATVDTNVFNLAANKGYLIPPSYAPEFDLSLKLSTSTTSEIVLKPGDLIASLGNYYFYALESKTINSSLNSTTIRAVYGYKNTYTKDILNSKKNETYTFTTRDKYIGSQLEYLLIDSSNIELSSDSSIYSSYDQFILRRILYYTSKLYLGNGKIGYYNQTSKNLVYNCISYNTDILDSIDDTPSLAIGNLILNSKTLVLNPSFDPDIEQVRNVSRYYPIDGRVVRDKDYKETILKYFNSYLYDVLSYNSDPNQEVVLLIKSNFTNLIETKIQSLITNRIALGIDVNITKKITSDGKDFSFTCKINSSDYSTDLYSKVVTFLEDKKYKFLSSDITLTSNDLCIELSAKFGIEFFPNDTNSIILLKDDFLKSLTLNIQIIN